MNDWVGKTLDEGLQVYLYGSTSPELWTWLALANLCLGLFFAAFIAGRRGLRLRDKALLALLGFLLPPVALVVYGLGAGRR